MASVSIVGENSANAAGGAPHNYLSHLASLLESLDLGDRQVIINGAGESLVPGPTRAWTPDEVADWVNQGNIWIDWCGWPMYYEVNTDGAAISPGASGFQTFAAKAGYPWLDQETFDVPTFGRGSGFPFVRGFAALGSVAGVYLPVGTFIPTTSVPSTALGQPQVLSQQGWFAMMALHAPRPDAPSAGFYFYASQTGSIFSIVEGSLSTAFVPAETIASFVNAVVHGNSKAPGMTITHAPYQVTVPKSISASGPTSPYKSSSKPASSPGIRIEGDYFYLLTALSAQQVAIREGVSLSALLAANPGATFAKAHPTLALKAHTRLRIPSASTGSGSTTKKTSTGSKSGTSTSTGVTGWFSSLPTWGKVLIVGGGGIAAGGSAFAGARYLEERIGGGQP